MDYLISTEFVREHGDAIAQGVQFFNYLTYCGMEHVQFGKYTNHVEIDVYCDSPEEAQEVSIISQDFLLRGWVSTIEAFLGNEPNFWLVKFQYRFASLC